MLALLPTVLLLPHTIFAAESPEDAHSKATDYMFAKYQGGATGSSGVTDDDIPIIFSAVNGSTLVVGISADVLAKNITYTEQQVQDFLGITTPVDIMYMIIESNTGSPDVPFNADDTCLADEIDPAYTEFCINYFEDLESQRQYEESIPQSNSTAGQVSGTTHPDTGATATGSASSESEVLRAEDICNDENHPYYLTFCLDHFNNLREEQAAAASGDQVSGATQTPLADTVCYTEIISPEYQDMCANYFETMEEDARDVLSSSSSSVQGQVSGSVGALSQDLLESGVCFQEEIDPMYQDACRHYFEDFEEDDPAKQQVNGQDGQSMTPLPTTESFDDVMTLIADVCFQETIDPAHQDLCMGFLEDLENERLSNPVSGQSTSNPCTTSPGGSICYYYNRYISQCLPPNTASRCSTYASIITNGGFQLPTSPTPPPPPSNLNPSPVTVPSGRNVFYDSFSSGLGKWTVSGNSAWRTGIFDESYRNSPLYTSSDIVAEADYCYNDCVLTSQSINLRGQSWAYLEFGRFVDNDFDGNEGMKVELYDGTRWNTIYHWTDTNNGDDDTWHIESFNLANYRVSNFKIKVTVESNSRSEDAALNNVRVVVPSTPTPTPPAHSNPSPVTIPTTGVNIFSTTFESGLSSWTLSGDGRWRTGVFDESYRNAPTYTSSDIVAESDNCDNTCIMTSSSINLRGKSWAYLEFGRYMDNDLDGSEGIKVELYDGTRWTTAYHWTATAGHDDDRWHIESLRLSSSYLTSNFKIRITATSNSGSEDIGINNVRVVVPPSPSPTPPPSSSNINPRPVTIPSNGINVFSDTFENGLSKWTLSGQGRWTAKVFDESFRNSPTYTASDKVANSNNCDNTCIMTSSSINLQGKSWAYLQFGRYMDNSFDGSEGIKVEIYDGTRWTTAYHWTATAGQDDDTWHIESLRLSSSYLTSNFKIRITATSSTSAESAGINNVRVAVPPTVVAPPPPPTSINPTPVMVPSSGINAFADDFENGISKWTLSGAGRWTTGTFDESYRNPPLYTHSDLVAESNSCNPDCVMTSPSINLRGKSWAYLEFGRFIDNGFAGNEGIKVELYDGTRWTTAYHWTAAAGHDDDRWYVESMRLNDYLVSNFKIRITANFDSSWKDPGINNVRVLIPDTISSTITAPPDITRTVTSNAPLTINLGHPSVPDSSYIITNDAPSTFTPGTYTITWLVQDAFNNLFEVVQNVFITLFDTDRDGVFDIYDSCPNIRGVFVDGCPSTLYGGMGHVYVTESTLNPFAHRTQISRDLGTIGIGAIDSLNRTGIVVAGHTVYNFDTIVGHYLAPSPNPLSTDRKISTLRPAIYYYGNTDVAFITITNTSFTSTSQVVDQHGSVTDVIFGHLDNVNEGELLKRYGYKTYSEGLLLYKNATFRTHHNFVLTDIGVATYSGVPGDSGSPIIHNDNGRSYIVGIHHGRACSAAVDEPLTTMVDLCEKHGTGLLGFFTAWENVVDTLMISPLP